ncbi:Mss4p nuclear export [Malassezia cuniculi]|uniref:Mss4p nuclear export n=1 Tax=Malassezia cuniculi TaxID=948313 RepID=A0AAF0ENW7_9BASI|nr:Mss4p nuclear export [Malassezia cuniculi]
MSADSSDSESDVDFINVEFDFQAPVETDYQALKRLFQQLYYTHSPDLDLGVLADWVIARGAQGVGTVIKADDAEEVRDPYAVISAVDLYAGNSEPAAEFVQDYLVKQLSRVPAGRPLQQLLEQATAESPLLYVIHERMINMPVPIMPPLLRFIVEETENARAGEKKPTHAIFFSRAFSADALEEDADDEPTGLAGARKRKAAGEHAHPDDAAAAALGRPVARKQSKGGAAPVGDNYGSFRPEDEFVMEVASHGFTFRFPPPRDAAEGYEPPLFGRILAVPYARLPQLISRIEAEWPAPAAPQ